MKEEIHYYPRRPFWAFWQKRQVWYTLTASDEGVTRRFYDEDGGWLTRISIEKKGGGVEYSNYYPSGQIEDKTTEDAHGYSLFTWDPAGNPLGGEKYDRDTHTKTYFHPNGNVKIRHNIRTGDYEEFKSDGQLKRKGLWVNDDGTVADNIRTCGSRFETGNMRAKFQDEKRQEYIEAIDCINNLPATPGRKAAKKALLKAFKDHSRSR